MAQKKSNNPFFSNEYLNSFSNMPGNVPFELQDFMEVQRKNFQAFTEIQQIAIENIQAAAQQQTAMLSKIVEENSKMAKEMMAEGTPEEKVAKQADIAKKCYEKSVTDTKKITDMMAECSQQASEIINKRVSASLNEIKEAMQKSKKATSKAA